MLHLLLLFSGLAAAQPTPDAAPVVDDLELLYSGNTQGFGSDRHVLEVHTRAAAAVEAAGGLTGTVRLVHGVLSQDEHVLWSSDGTLASLLGFLDGQPSCNAAQPLLELRTPTEALQLPVGPLQEALRALPETTSLQRSWRMCTSNGSQAILFGPSSLPDWRLERFDVRGGVELEFQLEGATEVLRIASRPRQEAARRAALLARERAAAPSGLYAHAGSFVDGISSVVDGGMSLHREAAWDLLDRLEPSALAPGAGELAAGVSAFLTDARRRDLPFVDTNWSVSDPNLELPKVLRVQAPGRAGPLDIAFLGIVDPAILQQLPRLADEGLELTEPISSVQLVVDELVLSSDRPDLVILLADLPAAGQEMLRRRLHGVDLLIGDSSAATLRIAGATQVLRPVGRAAKAAPLTLPMDGVARARLLLRGGELASVSIETLPVNAESPPDPSITARITAVRAQTYPHLERPLIPASDPLAGVSEEAWERLVCEAVLDATGADAAFLAPLPARIPTPGDLTELLVAQRLEILDLVELHKIDGDRMVGFLQATHEAVPIQCGAPTGGRFPKVGGRYVDSTRTYLVATTDRTRLTTSMGNLLSGGSSDFVLHHPKFRVATHPDGRPLTLRTAVLDTMRAWRDDATTPDWTTSILDRSATDLTTQWTLDVRRISFQIERFQGTGTDIYQSVPDTLLNAPSSFTIGGNADIALATSGRIAWWDLRFRGDFAELRVQDNDPAETADDLRVSTSIALPVAGFPRQGGFMLWPFVEFLYDSEFTALRLDDGTLSPRQSDLSVTVGLGSWVWRWMRSLRVGAFANRDLARLAKETEYGGRLEAETRHDFLRNSSLRLTTLWDLAVWGSTPTDDAADLRMRLWGEARLSVRLIRWLDLGLYGRGLVVQGRVPETRRVGASWTLGASLDMSAAFRLDNRSKRR